MEDCLATLFADHFLVSAKLFSTRYTFNKSAVLDLVITSTAEFVKEIICLPDEFPSDHLMMKCCFTIPIKRIKPIKRTVYNYKKADMEGLHILMRIAPWDLCFNNEDLDGSVQRWTDLFLTTIESVVPKSKVRATNRAPWIDAEVLSMVRKKERLRKKAKRRSSDYHWEKFRQNQYI